MGELDLVGLTLTPQEFDSRATRFDLECHLWEQTDRLQGSFFYSTDLFDESTIKWMIGSFEMLLEAIVDDPTQPITTLPILTETERQLLAGWNETAADWPRQQCVHQLVEDQAASAPENVAVVFGDEELSYRDLNERANQLARYLQKLGVGPDSVVGIYMRRSVEMMLSVLGVLKAGGAYLPLDPEYPQERRALMLADAGVEVVLTQQNLAGNPSLEGAKILSLDKDWELIVSESVDNPSSEVTPANLAYIIYTSGSTGRPKGVAMIHRPIVNFLRWQRVRCATANAHRTLQFASLSFDVSFQEIFSTWSAGGTLVLVDEEVRRDSRALLHVLVNERIERLFMPFVALQYLSEVSERESILPSSLREVVASGEQLKITRHVRGMFEKLEGCRIDNQYGPSESHVMTAFMLDGAVENWPELPPIGRPIDNARVYVLDEQWQEVPVGVRGELYIGGECLSRGYLNRATVSAEKFTPDPFAKGCAGRLYRTGDLVRFLADGNLEFAGRRDHQVKIRGYRIEVGEVEAVLRQHASVREAVVDVRETETGEKRLVGYLLLDVHADESVSEIRRYLSEKLPEYMLPSAFVLLDAMPLTPSGKVDRRALPAPDYSRAEDEDDYVASRTPTEELLTGLWSRVLGMRRVGVQDNFFDIGGHSLLATQLMSGVRESFKLEVPLRTLFEAPTVCELAARIDAMAADSDAVSVPPLQQRERRDELPLSYAQQRLWFFDQFEPDSVVYNLSEALRLSGSLDIAALERAIGEVLRRHEVMRSTFKAVEGRPVQVIRDFEPVTLPVVDLAALPHEEQATEVTRLANIESQKPFDLEHGPLLRASLLRLSDTEHVLLCTMHHIISDGWSIGVLIREMVALYEAFSAGKPLPLAELRIQYADYAVWQREWMQGEVLERQLDYWRRQLEGVPPLLSLPTDRPRPAVHSSRGATLPIIVPEPLLDALKELARSEGVTLFMLLLAAFQTLLARYSRQTDIVTGTPIAGRNHAETEGLIGFFVNTLALRTDISGNPTFRELLVRVREVALAAYAHQDLPFEKLVDELQPERSLSYAALFQVMFVLQNAPQGVLKLPGLKLQPLGSEVKATNYDLTLSMTERDSSLHGILEYSTDPFEAKTVRRMGAHFVNLLKAVVAAPQQRVGELSLLGEEERARLLSEWNITNDRETPPPCLHELFERQAAQTPSATAIVFEDRSLTYQQLDQEAERLARRLRAAGVAAEHRVGVLMRRRPAMVIALLGVLKAGGAYVPLDPEYPHERVRWMMADAGVKVVVTGSGEVGEVRGEEGVRVVIVDEQWEEGEVGREESESGEGERGSRARAENLAYVIYTSGSTGTPKGAMNTHRGIVNRLLWMQETYQLSAADSVLQKTPFSFDVSVWEFFWPLLTGARLVLARPGGQRDSAYLMDVIKRERITTLHFVPSMLQAFLEDEGVGSCESVLRVICSGEALGVRVQERFFEKMGSARLYNLYGPTEAAVDVTSWECRRALGQRTVPIGKPIANTELYILDGRGREVPVGVSGELYIGGAGLGRGYLNRADLTAERFVPHPFTSTPGERLYRTGDLTRYLADGDIEFIRRLDDQVKVRGYRIELGEIETALSRHPGVQDAVVLAREYAPGDVRLVAYLVPHQQHAFVPRQLLRFESQGLLANRSLYELPNGMPVLHQNKSETEFLYEEIFVEQSYLRHGVTLKDGDCVFDVGANVGLFTLFVSEHCKDATIFAFEPIPPTFELLRLNTKLYGLDVQLFECGLSHGAAYADFTHCANASIISGQFADETEEKAAVKSFLLNQQTAEATESPSDDLLNELLDERMTSKRFTCRLMTISEVIRGHGIERIDLLKVDMEKGEANVLAGIEDADWQKIKQLVVEVHNKDGRLKHLTELMRNKGYNVTVSQEASLKDTDIYNIYAVREVENVERVDKVGGEDGSRSAARWNNSKLLVNDVRQHLATTLPDYMTPAAFVLLEALPLTPNGKLDRRALPAPELKSERRVAEYVGARTPVEEALCAMWGKLLGVEQVGVDDNFFELGGHSLFATRLISRIHRAFGVRLPLHALFESPTVGTLAALISSQGRTARDEDAALKIVPVPRDREAALPLSFAQRRLWFLQQLEPDNPFYNIPMALRLSGTLDTHALARTLCEVLRRHEVLRTTFSQQAGEPRQLIAPPSLQPLPAQDLSTLREHERHAEALRLAHQAARRPFDLSHETPLRALLLRLDEDEHLLVVVLHHIASDGWSMSVLVREVAALYEAYAAGRPSPLPELAVQYADYAVWQRQYLRAEVLEEQLGGEVARSESIGVAEAEGASGGGELSRSEGDIRVGRGAIAGAAGDESEGRSNAVHAVVGGISGLNAAIQR